MKSLNLKVVVLALGLTAFASASANAANLVHTADSDPSPYVEAYDFVNNTIGATFTNYVAFAATPFRDLVASVSGNSASGLGDSFAFTGFDLLGSDMSTVLAIGTVGSAGAHLSFGGLESFGLGGDYFLRVTGLTTGVGNHYSGQMTLSVPEPETYGMMLMGLGLMGFIARRRRNDQA